MTNIGIIGAGHIGSQVARLFLNSGYDVTISNSRGPDTLGELVASLNSGRDPVAVPGVPTPGRAQAATAVEAARAGELVVVTIPLKNYREVPVAPLQGKLVIDTNNYYPQRDGQIPEIDDGSVSSSELLQAHLPRSMVVKAFNHIRASELTTDGQPRGSNHRRALAIAGNDAVAKATVARLLDGFGFDTVDVGPLAESWRFQPGTPGYGPRRTAEELRRDLAAAAHPGPA
jgi:8-hydroxy-5-deazaflavin:NADPH oxidoreductase